jgi:hypothetical protein
MTTDAGEGEDVGTGPSRHSSVEGTGTGVPSRCPAVTVDVLTTMSALALGPGTEATLQVFVFV